MINIATNPFMRAHPHGRPSFFEGMWTVEQILVQHDLHVIIPFLASLHRHPTMTLDVMLTVASTKTLNIFECLVAKFASARKQSTGKMHNDCREFKNRVVQVIIGIREKAINQAWLVRQPPCAHPCTCSPQPQRESQCLTIRPN